MAHGAIALWGLALAGFMRRAEGINSHLAALRSTQQPARSFIQTLHFTHTLRICNAYPLSSALDIYIGNGDVKLTTSPMPYKQCGDFSPKLNAGDRVDFKIEDSSAGTFTIADLPNGDATLLLVISRHDTLSTAVSFESHVFSSTAAPQIAVLDTFKGQQAAKVKIQDLPPLVGDDKITQRSEILRFDSVVAVDPGAYEVNLEEVGANETVKRELVALPREAYVVIRCGVEADEGESHPQDLVIFPHHDKSALGGALRARVPGASTAAVLFVALLTAIALPAVPAPIELRA